MPIFIVVTNDMFEYEKGWDYAVNLVNLVGVSGAGLALEMRNRCPSHIEKYKAACKSKELRIGTVQIIDETEQRWGIINMPTKRHYADTSDLDDISRSIEAFRDVLLADKMKYVSVGMPIPGSGLGKRSYDEVYPLITNCLSDLEATILLSLAPEKTDMRPRYLSIMAPIGFGQTKEEFNKIERIIDDAMMKWGTSLSEYDGIASGGSEGVEAYLCGKTFNKDYEDSYVFKKTGKRPMVVKPSVIRNNIGAVHQRDRTLCEIASDVILLKPHNFDNNRLNRVQIYLENDFSNRVERNISPRRVTIYGDKSIENKIANKIIIPVKD